jgi:hypothetical protein
MTEKEWEELESPELSSRGWTKGGLKGLIPRWTLQINGHLRADICYDCGEDVQFITVTDAHIPLPDLVKAREPGLVGQVWLKCEGISIWHLFSMHMAPIDILEMATWCEEQIKDINKPS